MGWPSCFAQGQLVFNIITINIPLKDSYCFSVPLSVSRQGLLAVEHFSGCSGYLAMIVTVAEPDIAASGHQALIASLNLLWF